MRHLPMIAMTPLHGCRDRTEVPAAPAPPQRSEDPIAAHYRALRAAAKARSRAAGHGR